MSALALFAAAALAAQPLPLDPVGRAVVQHMQQGLTDTNVGDWVTYQLDGGEGRRYFWRVAVVGQEKDKLGRDAFWIEIDVGEHHELKAPLSQMRMLVAKSTGMTRDGVTRIFATFGYEKPQEYGEDTMKMMEDEPRPPPDAPQPGVSPASFWLRTGKEARLMTLAGTVAAVPVELMVKGTVLKRMWVSRQVPVLHLAKMEIPAIEHSMEVRDFGIDARSRMVLPAPGAPTIHMERYDDALKVAPEGESDGQNAQPRPRP